MTDEWIKVPVLNAHDATEVLGWLEVNLSTAKHLASGLFKLAPGVEVFGPTNFMLREMSLVADPHGTDIAAEVEKMRRLQESAATNVVLRPELRKPIPDDDSPAANLVCTMSDASQVAWCASWYTPLENELWDVLTGERNADKWGNGLPQSSIDELRACVRAAGGWVGWDSRFGEYFIPMDQWLALGHKPLPDASPINN